MRFQVLVPTALLASAGIEFIIFTDNHYQKQYHVDLNAFLWHQSELKTSTEVIVLASSVQHLNAPITCLYRHL